MPEENSRPANGTEQFQQSKPQQQTAQGAVPLRQGGNGVSLAGVRAAMQAATPGQPNAAESNPLDQVRELLFGDSNRKYDGNIAELNDALRLLEHRLVDRLDGIDRRLDELARRTEVEQAQTIRSIGAAIEEVGRQISALATKPAADDAARD